MHDHFNDAFTQTFLFKGLLFVQKAISEFGLIAEEDMLVQKVKQNLLQHHRADHWVLHTYYCTDILIRFIRNIKAGMQPHGTFLN